MRKYQAYQIQRRTGSEDTQLGLTLNRKDRRAMAVISRPEVRSANKKATRDGGL